MKRAAKLSVVLLVWAFAGTASNGHATITADLSRHLIAITTAFTGTQVLLFGSIDQPDGDVVVTVFGPLNTETVRRKSRIGPVWLNTDQVSFVGVPFFYAVSASRPLHEIADATVLRRHRIGIKNLRLRPQNADKIDAADRAVFREGLIRNKQKTGLYTSEPGRLEFVGPQLFRADLRFPANIQPGSYRVEVLHLRDGQAVGAQTSALSISKIGIEAEIFDLAYDQAAVYGFVCIVLAIVAGWSASVLFRRP